MRPRPSTINLIPFEKEFDCVRYGLVIGVALSRAKLVEKLRKLCSPAQKSHSAMVLMDVAAVRKLECLYVRYKRFKGSKKVACAIGHFVSITTYHHSHFRMQELLGSAVQILYCSCIDEQGSPGFLLEQDNGTASTIAILECLGLIGAGSRDFQNGIPNQHGSARPSSESVQNGRSTTLQTHDSTNLGGYLFNTTTI